MRPSPRTRTPVVAPRLLPTAASVGCALFVLSNAGPVPAQSPGRGQRLLDGAERIVFLGDSNTNAGGFVYRLEAALRQGGRIGEDVEVINLGLSSETCSGLSEAAHPFPRPDVHERLDRALENADPDLVFACYGMNDGIYSQFRTDRFEAFQNGITELAEKVKASGAKLVLVTPPPFDPEPLRAKGQLRPAGQDRYDWTRVYEDYDRDVIAKYAEWMRRQRGLADLTIDLHRRLARQLAQLRRSDPEATLTTDGVHFNEAGHAAVAEIIHGALGFGRLPELDRDLLDRISRRHAIMHPAWLGHVGHERPGVKPGLPLEEARAVAADPQADPGNIHVFDATTDFPDTAAGAAPYYVDKARRALAINAAETAYRDKFARATTTFRGPGGKYDVTVAAMGETDGECTYRLVVDGKIVGTAQNASTTTDYAEQRHTFEGIAVPGGAEIAVESNAASNGQIPEGDGFAFARGRWTTLTMVPVAAQGE